MSKTVEDIGTLKINLLSQAQYDAEKAGGRLADDELYLTPSSGTGVSDVEVNGSSVVSGGVAEIELKTINQNSIVGSGNIDIQGGAGVFVAEYGVTLYADIRDAILDGQSVICLMQDEDLMLTLALADYDFDYGLIDFSVLAQSMGNYVSVYSNDEWASAVFTIAPNDTATQLRDGLMTALDKQKLDGIASGAEVNVQSDWNQATSTADDYIKNKPTIPTVNDATLTIQKNGSTVNTFTANASSNVTANITVPTDTGDLTNGAGYITGYTETDPTVPSWAKASSKPSYTFSEIGSKPTTISGYGITDAKISSGTITLGSNTITPLTSFTETDPTVPSWAKQVSKPSYTASEVGALPDTTPIPSNTSDLVNDSGFITGVTSTSTPTANTIAEWDNDAQMNSTDMTSQEVDDFVDSLNVQKILGMVEVKTLLWTNADPYTGVGAFSVSLDLTEYDEVEIYFQHRAVSTETNDYYQRFAVGSGGIAWHTYTKITEVTKYVSCREVSVANTGVTFSVGRYGATNAASMNDYSIAMIPEKIYGIKHAQL